MMQRNLLQSRGGTAGCRLQPSGHQCCRAWALRWHWSRAPIGTLATAQPTQGHTCHSWCCVPTGQPSAPAGSASAELLSPGSTAQPYGAAKAAWGGKGDLVLYFKGHSSSTKSSQMRAAAGRTSNEKCKAAARQRQCAHAQQHSPHSLAQWLAKKGVPC